MLPPGLEGSAAYTTYVNVPPQPLLAARLQVKQKGEQWKPRWVILKGPGLSAFKLLGAAGDGSVATGNVKVSVDLGKSEACMVEPPEKYAGREVIGVKPGKGLPRCYLQCPSAAIKQQWAQAIRASAQQAKAAQTVMVRRRHRPKKRHAERRGGGGVNTSPRTGQS
jgi:hypothetical protein